MKMPDLDVKSDASYLTRLEKDAKGSLTAILILMIIKHDKQTWGYNIRKKLAAITDKTIEVNYSSLYTILRNFEEKYSLIESKIEDKRRYYSITSKGNKELVEISNFWKNLIDTANAAFKQLDNLVQETT